MDSRAVHGTERDPCAFNGTSHHDGGLSVAAIRLQQAGNPEGGTRSNRIVRSEHALADIEHLLIERQGLFVALLLTQRDGKVVERERGVRVISAEQSFAYGCRFAEMRFGVGVAVLTEQGVAEETVEIGRHEMFGTVLAFGEGEGLAGGRFGVLRDVGDARLDLRRHRGNVVGGRGGRRRRGHCEDAGQEDRQR